MNSIIKNRNIPEHYKINGQDTINTIVSIVKNNKLKTEEGLYLFNVLKYLIIFNNKDGMKDLVKARDYLDRLMEVYGKEDKKNV